MDNDCCDRSEPSEIDGDRACCRSLDTVKTGGVGIRGAKKMIHSSKDALALTLTLSIVHSSGCRRRSLRDS